MKKVTTLLCSMGLVAVTLFSCSKSNNTPANPNPIVGLWVGTATYSGAASSGSLYYSYDLRADSTLLFQGLGADGNTYYGAGKWYLSDSSFSATYHGTNLANNGVILNVSAVYNSAAGTLIGTQVVSTNASAIGTFTLNRIN